MIEKSAPDPTRVAAATRLHDALTAMLQQQASGNSSPALTVTALCERAGISRNALYRYHPDVLQALRDARQHRGGRCGAATRVAHELRQENAVLREQLAKLAALVDHYFAAWQETRLLLQRRDRELAESRRAAKVRVVSIAPEHRSN